MASIRIIPALAGNTTDPGPPEPLSEDHPRSRGEYRYLQFLCILQSGSSPLSRGIQQRSEIRHTGGRIIPALAGNTGVCCRFRLPRGDHPRSRGEYRRGWRWRMLPCGSSPLSRGILSAGRIQCVQQRIIPALAGNTRSTARSRRCGKDHPRSRGEYPLPSQN